METLATNALAASSSSYLRSAMHQPVQWHEWGPEVFSKAAAENKPILLDIGAVWCHWCHVMDRESYEDPATAELINREFIALKVDRDERPDVDSRYQAAVSAISGQGGWPLTAFLTPDGKPYFGGTYFPPDERMGRPGFRRVLQTMADAFRNRRDEVDETAGSVLQAVEYNEAFNGGATELEGTSAGIALIDRIVASALKSFDPRHGGFGTQPKFPHPATLDLLIDAASRSGPNRDQAAKAATVTLKRMFNGGIFDQLAGGFHRYSVDERWVVPHFEKMSYDNAGLLLSYTHAFQTFSDPAFAYAASEIMRWMDTTLTDREHGGFYASQDADLNLDDDGDHFTWTRSEAAAVLMPEELAAAELHWDIGPVGDMHHDPTRNVLFIGAGTTEIAQRLRKPEAEVEALLASSRTKLQAERDRRAAPFVDRTLYTGWNAMCIAAYLQAARVFQRPDTLAFALKSLDRVLQTALTPEQDGTCHLGHVVAYPDGQLATRPVPAVLDDYAFLGNACLDAWESTGESRCLDAATRIAATLLARFADAEKGGFFDTESTNDGALGALAARRKPLQDAPTPAGNSVAATLLLRLSALTGREDYRAAALGTLECFAAIVEHFGLYASSFGLALTHLVRPAVQVVILGEGRQAAELELAAMAGYAVNRTIIRLRRDQLTALPAALQSTLPGLPAVTGALALVCTGNTCQPPADSVDNLISALNTV